MTMQPAIRFSDDSVDPAVRGWLHKPAAAGGDALVLTHGAGLDCSAPLLVALSAAFAAHGCTVLRCDLPFRQARRFGPPSPAHAQRDRAGLHNAVTILRKRFGGRMVLGGHSYGGRQASMLCAEEPDLVAGMLLLSYPLHPPRKPTQLRTQHFPNLRTPCLFVHGTRDPLGSMEEMTEALRMIPARVELMGREGAGHDLGFKGKQEARELPTEVAARWNEFLGGRAMKTGD
jgi:predicted alpha/beta-hydrolase family hydrolase